MSTFLDGGIVSGGDFPAKDPTCGYKSLGEYCWDKIAEYSDRVLLVYEKTNEEITGKQLLSRSAILGRSLIALGIRSGDTVAICCNNDPDYCYVMIAAFLIGAAIVPLATNYADPELIHLLSLSRPSIVFAVSESIDQVRSVSKKLDFIKEVILYDEKYGKSHDDGNNLERFNCEPEDMVNRTAIILSSSGTTGMPKGVELTQMNVFASFYMDYIDDSDTYMSATPLIHLTGFFFTMRWLMTGKKAILLSRYDTEPFLRIIQEHKIAAIFLARPHMYMFANHPSVENYNLSSLNCIIYGSAPIHDNIVHLIRQRIGCKIICQVYGLTEAMGLLVQPKHGSFTPNSIGKLRPGSLGKIVDSTTGDALQANQYGEMMFKSMHNMKGYVNDAVATKNAFDSDGFMHTGDIGYYNDDGEWFFVERIKELIKYNNVNISPTELETIILMHPSVKEVCVIGKPNEDFGELPLAFIIKNTDDDNVSENEIIEFMKKYLAPPKVLYGGVRFVDSLPKNNMGKNIRRKLIELLHTMDD